jgi:murein DD-endopeptidase MepM/ murein hydrolase activator NlpD
MRPKRALAVLLAVALGGVGTGVGVARAQIAPTTTTTSTTTTTTAPALITVPGQPAPTTTAPPGPTTTVPGDQPPVDPDEAQSEPPPDDIVVPPPAQPAPPPANAPQFTAELRKQLKVAQGFSRKADQQLNDVSGTAQALQVLLASLRQQLTDEEAEHGRAIRRLEAARSRLKHRALGAYTGNELSSLNSILSSGDVNEMIRRSGMVETVMRESKRDVSEYAAAKKAAGDKIVDLVDRIGGAEADLSLAQLSLQQAYAGALDAHLQVESLAAGSAIAVKGFVFPVAAPHKFGNDFGNPRMVGTQYEHTHQGTDIFAEYGAPLVACERGVVTRVGTDTLGGTKLWVVGQSGTRYYYAHLSGYAPGLADGMVVEAGTLVGFVGDSGNARGGTPHLHFEVHPQGGPAVNPYFLLRAADKVGANAPPPTTAPAPPSSPPPAA